MKISIVLFVLVLTCSGCLCFIPGMGNKACGCMTPPGLQCQIMPEQPEYEQNLDKKDEKEQKRQEYYSFEDAVCQ